ncbi:hypothetical protein KR084_010992 [Drosophila pseudotakahashii]|nr:hypothetical protein KR084_010992 [Drosophila pseudotakahashii]
MDSPSYRVWYFLILLFSIYRYSMGIFYEFILEDERIFTDCEKPPPGSQNLNGLFSNFSGVTFIMSEKGVYFGGNLTTSWNIQKADSINAALSMQYFDRGSWVPTVLNLSPKNVCKSLFDDRQYLYTFFFKNVENVAEIQEKCVNIPGTVLVVNPYYFDIKVGLSVSLKPGRYKIEMILTAVDENGVERSNKICTAIRGEMNKIK